MSTKFEENFLATKLKEMCLEKLSENSHKPHWNDDNISFLISRIKEEIKELEEAILDKKGIIEVWREASDVANFAAMIAENYEHSKKQG